MTQQQTSPAGGSRAPAGFEVRLENFTGPFDLLLGLISKHEMDITEIALARVTDEFIAYIRRPQELGKEWALDEASEFLVLAATLLDLKAARLLPAGEVENDDDIALLEARDLLFARLLQYKAFKEIAAIMGGWLDREADRFPRLVGLEPQFASLLPELLWRHSPEKFAALARKALAPREAAPTEVGLSHLHAPTVSVLEQAQIMRAMLAAGTALSFRVLIADAETTMVVVARFLALLEMFRDAAVTFEQASPLGELQVRWTGVSRDWRSNNLSAEYAGVLSEMSVPEEAIQ
ncbi:ScpA family protein [Paenarthrobacter sp. PH39-S1]|uniref:segregation and condensation protein A n=1 Tax=Paenarthrobacter sp. PH39-S1 TaxID=3046204 RepID=UPI0024BBA25E|nr:ScpA family protein [Paenarthrobacter sp. PH39-S1]MDJ0356983.1 ScpA family protein [Paenarthrobacter sp. PH39-S1]